MTIGGSKLQFNFKENHIESQFNYGKLVISGDDTYGIRPYQLLVSSIASCSGLVFQKILQKQRTEIEQLTIDATVDRNEKEANKVEKIHLVFTVEGKDLNVKKLARNLKISQKNCSMVRSVEESIKITEQLKVIESNA